MALIPKGTCDTCWSGSRTIPSIKSLTCYPGMCLSHAHHLLTATMPEDTKKIDKSCAHIDALMKAGGQITLGRMAPLDRVAVAGDDHDIFAVLRRKPEESFNDLLQRLDEAIAVAQSGGARTNEIDDKRYVLRPPSTRKRR